MEPQFAPPAVSPDPSSDGRANIAIGALVLGVINLCAWFIPLCGGPLSIVGLVLGFLGLNSSRRNLAIAALLLCGIGLCLSMVNGVLGAVIAANGGWENLNFGQ